MSVMLSKILRESCATGSPNGRTLVHWCIGCNHAHTIPIEKKQANGHGPWVWNNDAERPTITPSLRVQTPAFMDEADWHAEVSVCHYVVTDGLIHYQDDCRHMFAGRTLPIPEWPLGRRP